MIRIYTTIWLICIVVCFPFTATAQEDKKAEFERLLQEGTVFYDATDYESALDRYTRARAIYDHPRLRLTIGKTYEKLNKCDAAKELYFGISNDPNIEQFERDRAKARLAVIDTECKQAVEKPIDTTKDEEPEEPIESDERDPPDPPDPAISRESEDGGKSPALLILGASITTVGVAGLVLGVVASSVDRKSIDDAWQALADQNGCQYDPSTDSIFDCPDAGLETTTAYGDIADEVSRSNVKRTAIFITGGVLVATGAGLLIYHFVRPAPETTQSVDVTFTPAVGPRHIGGNFSVRF